MSDLQIVTRLSILISGYASLNLNLSIYHWNVLVYLAWFSGLNHLCCLTFLRTYLYNHPVQRSCRIITMLAIVVMLVVVIYPTGRFQRTSLSAGTPALCFYQKASETDSLAYYSMFFSIVVICMSFASRVFRLHKTSSVQ